jgi:3'-phosphoadenosine 5'-phosphosulfate sulfotransferase (PAPS reductase)/FAD synthetase
MACESQQRQITWIRTGCNAFDGPHPSSAPLSFWTEQDILLYLKQFNVPYCPVYGEIVFVNKDKDFENAEQLSLIEEKQGETLATTGVKRTGCMFCMFGAHLEEQPGRFIRMKTTHPKQYAYCMKPVEEGGLGLDEVLTFIGVPH